MEFQIYVNFYEGGFSNCYQKMKFEDAIQTSRLFQDLDGNFYFRFRKGFLISRCYKIRIKKVIERRLPYLSYE